MSQIALRHIRKLGELRNVWAWDASTKEIVVCVNLSTTAPVVHARIPLCGREPRVDAFKVSRLDESTFRVMQTRCVLVRGFFDMRVAQCHPNIPLSPIILIGAPEDIADQMGAL